MRDEPSGPHLSILARRLSLKKLCQFLGGPARPPAAKKGRSRVSVHDTRQRRFSSIAEARVVPLEGGEGSSV